MRKRSFKCILQHDSMQCGAACLSMVCSHYGLSYPIDQLSNMCPATTEGVSLYGMTETAKSLGLCVTNVKMTTESLSKETLPAIIHWNQNHFVVLYKIKKNSIFYIADPGKGLVKCNLNEFERGWISIESEGVKKGIAMLLEPEPGFKKQKKCVTIQSKHVQGAFCFLFSYIRQYHKRSSTN